jgi:hypothetical protein
MRTVLINMVLNDGSEHDTLSSAEKQAYRLIICPPGLPFAKDGPPRTIVQNEEVLSEGEGMR